MEKKEVRRLRVALSPEQETMLKRLMAKWGLGMQKMAQDHFRVSRGKHQRLAREGEECEYPFRCRAARCT